LRALALGDDANCAHPVVVFNTGLSSTDFVLDSVSYPHPSGSGNQYGRRYVYEGPSSRSAYLPNPVIDAYCTGACRPQQTCGTPGICDADAQPECVVDLLAAPGHQSEGETVNLCVDTMLDISGCNRQAAGWRTAAGPFAPSVVNATCPSVLDRDRADANVVNCLYLCNAYQFCWTSSEYQGCATNPPPKPNSGFDPAAVKTNWCLQYCSAFAQCERAVNSVPSVSSSEARRCQREVTALCTAESVAGCPSGGTIQASDCQSRIAICKAFTHRAVPFCGDDCTAVCRARYQARDSEGRPAYRYGRGEDLQHKIVEIWATATGAPDRLLQKNQYGSSPALPSFDKVVSQQLGGDDLLDRSTPNTIQFYYFDLVHPTAPKIDPGLRYRKYVDVNFTAIDICPACLLPSLPIPRWFPSLPRIIN
jgi:hypothetical protein